MSTISVMLAMYFPSLQLSPKVSLNMSKMCWGETKHIYEKQNSAFSKTTDLKILVSF